MEVNISFCGIRNVSKSGVCIIEPYLNEFLSLACAPAVARFQAHLGRHSLKFPFVGANLKAQ